MPLFLCVKTQRGPQKLAMKLGARVACWLHVVACGCMWLHVGCMLVACWLHERCERITEKTNLPKNNESKKSDVLMMRVW